jgi:hypothetical protein
MTVYKTCRAIVLGLLLSLYVNWIIALVGVGLVQ